MLASGTTIVRKLLAGAAALAFAMPGARSEEKAKPPASIWEQETLTGDWNGARTALKDKGIDITLISINEIMGVLSGGLYRQASYEGRIEFSVDADLQKLVGWNGATTHFTIYQLHNAGHVAADNVGSIGDVSNIDALATTRLFTAWFQQNLFDDKVSLRVGQIAADDEFLNSPTSAAPAQRHLRLGEPCGRQHVQRRTGLSVGDARRARRRQADRPDHLADRGVLR